MRYGNKGEKKYLASFVGYFPVKKPIYSCIVSIAASGENIYGASVSGTVFAAIANKVYATSLRYHRAVNEKKVRVKDIPISKDGNRHDLLKIYNQLNIPCSDRIQDDWVNTISSGKTIDFTRRSFNKGVVPNVIGMSAKDAVHLIESAEYSNMKVIINGYGTVVKQSIPPGAPAWSKGVVELFLK
jgi:cell division protein FtsI (penicillin-binding protein 3)